MTIVGGLRARYLHDSFQLCIEDGLRQLGWFDPGRSHEPVIFLGKPFKWDEPAEPNSVIITGSSQQRGDIEVGSNLGASTIVVATDVYAQSDALAVHLVNDIRDILRGRLTDRLPRGSLPILDLGVATPVPVGYAAIANVRLARVPPQFAKPSKLHWYGLDADVTDNYYDSETP